MTLAQKRSTVSKCTWEILKLDVTGAQSVLLSRMFVHVGDSCCHEVFITTEATAGF